MLPTVDGPVSLIASALRAVLPLARPAGSPENGDVDLYYMSAHAAAAADVHFPDPANVPTPIGRRPARRLPTVPKPDAKSLDDIIGLWPSRPAGAACIAWRNGGGRKGYPRSISMNEALFSPKIFKITHVLFS